MEAKPREPRETRFTRRGGAQRISKNWHVESSEPRRQSLFRSLSLSLSQSRHTQTRGESLLERGAQIRPVFFFRVAKRARSTDALGKSGPVPKHWPPGKKATELMSES